MTVIWVKKLTAGRARDPARTRPSRRMKLRSYLAFGDKFGCQIVEAGRPVFGRALPVFDSARARLRRKGKKKAASEGSDDGPFFSPSEQVTTACVVAVV
jgi:hypothetical protein